MFHLNCGSELVADLRPRDPGKNVAACGTGTYFKVHLLTRVNLPRLH